MAAQVAADHLCKLGQLQDSGTFWQETRLDKKVNTPYLETQTRLEPPRERTCCALLSALFLLPSRCTRPKPEGRPSRFSTNWQGELFKSFVISSFFLHQIEIIVQIPSPCNGAMLSASHGWLLHCVGVVFQVLRVMLQEVLAQSKISAFGY